MPKRLLAAAAALTAVFLAAGVFFWSGGAPRAAAQSGAAEHTLTASGSGSIEVKPDRAIITLGIDELAPTAGEAHARGAAAMNAIVDGVKGLGLPETHIKTAMLNLQAEYQWEERTRERKLVGYRLNSTVTLTVDDLARAGAIIDAAVKAGANRVDNIRFDVKDRARLQRDAMLLALDDAREKAEMAAKRLGTQVIGISTVSLSEVSPPPVVFAERAAPAMAAPEMPVLGGTTTVEARVTVVFRLP